jgi:crotonobetainyl-CoA:carnitine CoA-transferase CaiB-like acyl-CoA transferase
MLDLIQESDIVVENFSPGVMDRLGLGFDELCRRRPSLIMLSMSAAGADGPYAAMKGYGSSISSFGGFESLVHYEGERPIGALGSNFSDFSSAYFGLLAILSALYRRDRGEGYWIDLSQAEAVATSTYYAYEAICEGASETVSYDLRVQRAFECSDPDSWVVISTDVSKLEGILARPADPNGDNMEWYVAGLESWCRIRKRTDAVTELRREGIRCWPVLTPEEAEFEQRQEGRRLQGGSVLDRYVAPWRMELPRMGDVDPPLWGEHTQEVLMGLIGSLNEVTFSALKREGVIRT